MRYGEDGLSLAIVYYITSTIMVYTVGMFIASAGQMAWRDALAKLLRLPPVHAVILAMVVYNFHITVPAPIMRGVELAGQATIPIMIIVLGMQLADLHGKPTWKLTIPAVSLRLLVSPLIAVFVAGVMGLSGLGRSVSIVEVMMPTAVITMIIAAEFDSIIGWFNDAGDLIEMGLFEKTHHILLVNLQRAHDSGLRLHGIHHWEACMAALLERRCND